MNITKVKYERLFPIGSYLNEKIGFEAEIGFVTIIDDELNKEGIYPQREEQPQEVINKLRELAESIHKEKYPQYYQDNGEEVLPQVVGEITEDNLSTAAQRLPSKDDTIAALKQDISTVTSLKVLETYKFLAKQFPEIEESYQSKLKELQINKK